MNPWQSTSIVVASCAWLVAVGPGGAPVRAAAQEPGKSSGGIVTWRPDSLRPGDVWNTLTLDMKVEQKRLLKSGATVAPAAPVVNYTLERSSASGRWKTVVRVVGGTRAPSYALGGALIPPDPFPVSRIEDDEDGSPVRVYDRGGRLILGKRAGSLDPAAATTGSSLPRSNGVEWLDSLVATTAKRSTRQQALERQYGAVTTSGGVSRMVRAAVDWSNEIVIDPVNFVPIETKAMALGWLLSRRTFAYTPVPDGIVRTHVHAETLISVNGDRAIVDTTYSNIRLEWR